MYMYIAQMWTHAKLSIYTNNVNQNIAFKILIGDIIGVRDINLTLSSLLAVVLNDRVAEF